MKLKITVLLFLIPFSGIIGKNPPMNDMETTIPNTVLLPETNKQRLELVRIARSLLGKKGAFLHLNNKVYRNDCSGMIRALFDSIGINIYKYASKHPDAHNGVAIIYNSFTNKTWKDPSRIPRPGDLIFFNNTHDQNKNGKWDDPLSHVSMVTGIEQDGKTIVYIHHTNRGVRRFRMNLDKIGIYSEGHIKYNDYLRRRPQNDNDRSKYLSSNFFCCYMNILDN